jgi:gliding motility-associated-like protein
MLLLSITLSSMAQGGATTFEFTENKGQWDNRIKYMGQLPAGEIYLHKDGFTIVQHNAEELLKLMRHHHLAKEVAEPRSRKKPGKAGDAHDAGNNNGPEQKVLHSHAYRVTFLNASQDATIVPDKAIPTYSNYIIGNDRSKWAKHVKIFQAVTYKNIYPNIDIRYYSESGTLKYDIIVHPGGDVNKVALRYEGADKLLLKNNELIIKTSVADVKELYPYTYQFDAKTGKKEVKCSYVLDKDNNTVRFRVDDYNRDATLIVDPRQVFVTFTRSTADNWGFTATYGPDGTLYSGGVVFARGFPTHVGAYQEEWADGGLRIADIGIMKFSRTGWRDYATYIGGTGHDLPHSLVCDPAGNLVIMGRTYSGNYPVTVPRVGTAEGGCDILVTKLNADGSDLIGSFKIGGSLNDGVNIEDQFVSQVDKIESLLRNYGDDSHSEVILDGAGNIYVAAQTQSNNFPIIGPAFQTAAGGKQDGVVMKINPNCNNVIWSSYLGGAEDDAAFVLALQPGTNDLYVSGGTYSDNILPAGPNPTVIEDSIRGQADGYIAVIRNDGSALVRGTYLGTPSTDIIYGIQFDRNGFVYVMGVSRGSWPVINAVYSNAGSKQFISKINPDLSSYVYSTVFGSGSAQPNISPVAFLVDRCENVYISGWGGWIQPTGDPYDLATTVGMPVTPDAFKSTTDGRDFYFIVIKKDAEELLFGSFFGQNGGYGEHVDGGTSRFDSEGAIYMAICANCYGSNSPPPAPGPFPTTPGVWGPFNPMGTTGCNLAAVKIEFNFSGVGSGPKPFIGGVQDTVGCVPFRIVFRDTVRNAKRYIWNFGDGSPDRPSDSFEVEHTYHNVGTYIIRLIGIDSTTCNIVDTAYTTIYARDDQANLAMDITKLDPCDSLKYEFNNISTAPPGKPFDNNSFIWDFGDGTRQTAGLGPVTHSYTVPRRYTVRLIMMDTSYCNSPDSIPFDLSVAANVDARVTPVDPGCIPYTVAFDNVSSSGEEYHWDFGDGNTSTDMSPVHEYTSAGNYMVRLIVIDSGTCNIVDTTFVPVAVNPRPTAGFNTTPMPPRENTPTVFYNLSTGGVRYKWLFGDGDSTIRMTMDTVMHQYNATGIYEACLITYNQFDCTDTVCDPVQAIIVPLLDVPNAFTPGRGGQNSIIKVEGFGIGRMTWRIYNRWGQVVFETTNRKTGWNGTYKGQLQPMDVYAYTLDVEFVDGTKLRKTGDITLIR